MSKAKAAKKADADVEEQGYDEPPMTLWDHLAELRNRLVWSIVTLVLTTSVAWYFQEDLLAFFAKPFLSAWHERGLTGNPFNFKSPTGKIHDYLGRSLRIQLYIEGV